MNRRDGQLLWIDESDRDSRALVRVSLQADAGTRFDEAWLQALIHKHPQVLPIEQIEPGFGDVSAVCRELPLSLGSTSGNLDNFLMTRSGGIVLVEAKLWRNPEARRKVVAQAMDYAAAVFRLSYEQLEIAVAAARKRDGQSVESLAEIVGNGDPAFDPVQFTDAVTRNLKRGRAIVAVVGDGIREDIEAIAELLQSHAGLRFAFSLVELAVYEGPLPGTKLVRPSLLTKTTLIERGVVQIVESAASGQRIEIRPPPNVASQSRKSATFGLNLDEYMERLASRESGYARLLREFLARAEDHGIKPDVQRGISLKHAAPEGNDLNLAAIDASGFVNTGPATWFGPEGGRGSLQSNFGEADRRARQFGYGGS